MSDDAPETDEARAETARARVVAARADLIRRFLDKQARTPSIVDARPQGSGPPNRHGMPRVPVGQHITTKWPILDLGKTPMIDRESFRLVVDGAVARPLSLSYAELRALGVVDDVSDFHCVTTWSKLDVAWRGVRVSTVLGAAEPLPEATHLMGHGSDGYSTNLSLEEALKDDVLLVFHAEGEPLPLEHGGPVRMITPQLYAWKGAKWIARLELLVGDRPGFWEQNGYSMTAHPWRNDRYR